MDAPKGYLDDTSLRTATLTYKVWNRIITSNRKLREKLNLFELATKLGSKSLAKFYKNNKRILKRERGKKYLPVGKNKVHTTKSVYKSKRDGDDLIVYTKRFKLY